MSLIKSLQDRIITFFILNKAPRNITYSSDEPSEIFGFWSYIKEGEEEFVIMTRTAFLTYECIKFNEEENKKGTIYVKNLAINKNLNFNKGIRVNLFYNGYENYNLSPYLAYLYGVSHYYIFHKWFTNFKFKRVQSSHRNSLNTYKNKYHLIEALVELYSEEKDNLNVIIGDTIKINKLMLKLTNSNDIASIYSARSELEPTLKALEYDEIIELKDSNEAVKVMPKAWSALSNYYLEERRHQDNQKALKWQRILTAFLVFGSLSVAFFTFFRADVQLNLKALIDACFN